MYNIPTRRNHAVSYWRKILHIKQPIGRNYAISYWRKILQYIIYRLEEITPLVTGVKSYI